jgi:hypothetical protein
LLAEADCSPMKSSRNDGQACLLNCTATQSAKLAYDLHRVAQSLNRESFFLVAGIFMVEEPSIVKHPSGFLWGAAVRAAARRRFKTSMQCENAFKERIKSGLEVNKSWSLRVHRTQNRSPEQRREADCRDDQCTGDKRSSGGSARRVDVFSRALGRDIVCWSLADLLKTQAYLPAGLLNVTELRRFDEFYQHVHILSSVRFRLESLQGL